MEGHRGQAGTQISLAGEYQSTSARQLDKIKDEATSAAEWLVAHIQGRQEIQLEAVFRLCPKAVRAMQRDGTIAGVVIGIIGSGTKPANIVLSPTRDRRLAYRRWVSSGETGRLQGYAHSTTEAREPLANPIQGLILWSPASMNPLQWTYFSPIMLRGPGVSLRCSVILSQGLG